MKPVKPLKPTNPLREMRLALGYSLDRVAADLDTTRQFVIRAEQGVYATPPPALTDYLLTKTDALLDESLIPDRINDRAVLFNNPAAVGLGRGDIGIVYHLYAKFQSETRKANYGKLSPTFAFDKVTEGQHPFVVWRMRSGISARIRISKYLCVHPALVFKFESQPHLCTSPPGELLVALKESGYSTETLASFTQAYDHYKRDLSREFRKVQERRL